MLKQSDIDFANEVLRQGLVGRDVVEECINILKNLGEMGVEDALDGIMCLKGHLDEAQVSQVWKSAFEVEFDEDQEEAFHLEDFQDEGDAPAEAAPAAGKAEEAETPPEAGQPPSGAKPASAEKAAPAKGLPDLPGFTLEAKLEKDITGINYLGVPSGKKRKAVVHILYPQVAGDEAFMGWMIKHGRRLARLDHPSAAKFYPVQPFQNRAFFAQEIPQGEDLPTILEEEGVIEEERALLLLEQVAEVLQHAEERSIFHGRLTPQNVFLLDDNLVELRFFSFAERERKLFLEEPPPEALPFIPPEIRSGKPATVVSDLYSLGKILLRMTGADQEPPKPLSEAGRRIVGKLIAVVPSKRYRKVQWLLKDLERYFEGKAISEEVEPEPEEAPSKPRAKAGKPAAAKKKTGARKKSKPPKAAKAKPVEAEPVEAEPVEEEAEEAVETAEPQGRVRPKAGEPKRGREKRPSGPAARKRGSGRTRGLRRDAGEPRKGGGKTRVRRPSRKAMVVEEEGAEKERVRPAKKVSGPRKARPVEPVTEAEEEEEEEDSRVTRAVEQADRRESKGDLGGALEALKDVVDLAVRPDPVKQRIVDLMERGFSSVREEARSREAEGDYKGAIKVFEAGRIFAKNPKDVDEVIHLLEQKREEQQHREQVTRLEEKAKARLKKGDVLGAIACLEDAKEVSDSPLTIQARIDAMRKQAYEKRMSECQELESKKAFDKAIKAAQRAREFAENEETVEAIIKTLERKRDQASRQAEYKRCEEEAEKRWEKGDIEKAIEWYERAKTYTTSTLAVDAKIENLKHQTYEGFMQEARGKEEAGDFSEAILAWERARSYAPDPEEVEAAIQVLRDRSQADEREKKLQALRKEAESLEAEGMVEEAIARFQEAAKLAGGPSYSTRLKIDTLRKKAFDEGVALSEKRKERGDLDGAIEAVEAVRRYAPDERSVNLMVATLKREKSVEKKSRKFKQLEASAKAKARGGDILASLDLLEQAKAFAESPVAVQVKIDGLRKATFDRLMGEGKQKENGGEWTEALGKYREAKKFADEPGRVDEIIAALEQEMERVKKDVGLKRITASADELVKQGKIREAVAKLEEAKAYVEDPSTIQSRIDKLLIESMYQKCIEIADKKEAAGDFKGAVDACAKAKEYATDLGAVEKRIARLDALARGEEPPGESAPAPEARKAESRTEEDEKKEEETEEEPLPALEGEKAAGGGPEAEDASPAPEAKKAAPAETKAGAGRAAAAKASTRRVKKGDTSSMIMVLCPNPDCGRQFKVKSKFEGRKGKCPACGASVDVPVRGEKVVCFLCDKVLPKSKARKRGDEYYCSECETFIGGI